MKKSYRIAKKSDTRKIVDYLTRHGEHLLPLVELIEASKIAVGEMLDRLGRANLEAVLHLSAQKVAGEKHQGRKGGEVAWHGSQPKQLLDQFRLNRRQSRYPAPFEPT